MTASQHVYDIHSNPRPYSFHSSAANVSITDHGMSPGQTGRPNLCCNCVGDLFKLKNTSTDEKIVKICGICGLGLGVAGGGAAGFAVGGPVGAVVGAVCIGVPLGVTVGVTSGLAVGQGIVKVKHKVEEYVAERAQRNEAERLDGHEADEEGEPGALDSPLDDLQPGPVERREVRRGRFYAILVASIGALRA